VRRIVNLVSGGERAGYGILTVRENLWFYSQLYGLGMREGWRRIEELAEMLDMKGFLDVKLNMVSSGMAQKYNLARGLLNDPLVLFLDEPTLGLDVAAARSIRALIRRWVSEDRERTVFMTTHYMAEAEEMCDIVSIIHRGRIVATGSPEELKRMVSREVVYGVEVRGVSEEALRSALEGREWVVGVSARSRPSRGIVSARIVMRGGSASEVIRMVEEAGGEVISITRVEPSLEDVFLKLVGEAVEWE